jgi:NADH:ubiquinone oxidoreductase subunit K
MDDLIGSTLTLYILPLAGCESALALGILIAYYPKRGSVRFA